MTAPEIGPADFAPFRAEFVDCHCLTCREVSFTLSGVLDGPESPRHLAACHALLAELRAGTHKRLSFAERVAQAREEKAIRLARLRADGAPASEIEAAELGYVRFPFSDMVNGSGLGVGGRIQ